MSGWTEQRERTISNGDRVLNDIWFGRDRRVSDTAPRSTLVIGSDGPAIKDAVISAIHSARRMLVIGTFLIGSDEIAEAIERAWERDVRTYVLSASLEQLKTTRQALSDDDQEQVAAHQAFLDRLASVSLVRAAPGFHAKFVLADPFEGGGGLLLTANMRDGAMRSNDEIAVPIDPESTLQLANAVRWSTWEASTHQMTEPGRLAAVTPLGKVPWRAPEGPLTTTKWGDDITHAALELLDNATAPVIATSFTWAPANPVAARLCELARDGCDVTVVINPLVRSAVTSARLFKESGCRVLGRERMHAKALSVGGERGLVHTLNFDDAKRPDSTLDIGVLLDQARASDLHRLLEHWVDLAPYEFALSRKLADGGRSVILTNGKPVQHEIPAMVTLDLGTVVAPSADEMTATPDPPIPQDVLAQAIHARWTVEPPVLGPKARRVGASPRPGEPGLYRDGAELVVALNSIDALPAAQALKQQHDASSIVLKPSKSKPRTRP